MTEPIRTKTFWAGSFAIVGLALAGAAPLAAQKDCQPMFDALDKVMVTPTHIYTTVKKPGLDKPQTTETIYAKGIYTEADGKWSRSEITLEQLQNQERDNRKKSKYTCAYVKDEPVNGEDAILYKSHADTDDDRSDAQIWISKKGLPLKGEVVTESKGKAGKTQYSVRYEYKNVDPPKTK